LSVIGFPLDADGTVLPGDVDPFTVDTGLVELTQGTDVVLGIDTVKPDVTAGGHGLS
jgi:hypothetical protein